MKKLFIKDKKLRILYLSGEMNRLLMHFFIKSHLKYELKEHLFICRSRKFKFKVFTRIVNRCYYSNKARSIFSHFRLSRIIFREFACQGRLVGICKSSW